MSFFEPGASHYFCKPGQQYYGMRRSKFPIATTPSDPKGVTATPTKWTYTAIFWLNDQRVGQWSKPVSVTVGG